MVTTPTAAPTRLLFSGSSQLLWPRQGYSSQGRRCHCGSIRTLPLGSQHPLWPNKNTPRRVVGATLASKRTLFSGPLQPQWLKKDAPLRITAATLAKKGHTFESRWLQNPNYPLCSHVYKLTLEVHNVFRKKPGSLY